MYSDNGIPTLASNTSPFECPLKGCEGASQSKHSTNAHLSSHLTQMTMYSDNGIPTLASNTCDNVFRQTLFYNHNMQMYSDTSDTETACCSHQTLATMYSDNGIPTVASNKREHCIPTFCFDDDINI